MCATMNGLLWDAMEAHRAKVEAEMRDLRGHGG
jgi:hypothetical protein